MMNSQEVKRMARELGADLVGIASVQRFEAAPEGFKPTDVLRGAKSVIAYAKRLPDSVFSAESSVPYTFACSITLQEVFRVAYGLTLRMEDYGVTAVPIPSEPYQHGMRRSRKAEALCLSNTLVNLPAWESWAGIPF